VHQKTCAQESNTALSLSRAPGAIQGLRKGLTALINDKETRQMSKFKNPKSIIIVSRTWFDRPNGNTYFSAKAYLNGGETVFQVPFRYGYGEQIAHEVFQELEKAGDIRGREHYEHGTDEVYWRYCERVGIRVTVLPAAPVQSRKSLLW
jgi:hypothetical protein